MIDEKSKEIYQRIKAPEGLRERLLSYEPQSKRRSSHGLHLALTVAACLVLVVSGAFTIPLITTSTSGNTGNVDVFSGGQKIGTSPVPVSTDGIDENQNLRLMLDRNEIFLEVKGEKAMTVEVSKGVLRVEETSGQVGAEETSVFLKKGNCQLVWEMNDATDAFLTISTKDSVIKYEMYQDKTSKKYYMKVKDIEEL